MKTSKKPVFKIGCSGFYNNQWRKIFYPEKLPKSKWLNFYSEHLNSIEINSTFYHFPRIKTIQGWYDKTPEDFLFSIKAPKTITHILKFEDCDKLLSDFYTVCEQGLRQKLGCILFQLPPSFQFSEERLRLIINNLNPSFKNVVEFRHESWWTEKVYNELAKAGITFCSINHPKLPDTLITNTDIGYIRLHGNPILFYSAYSEAELTSLYQHVVKRGTLKVVFIYFNNTAGEAGIINARQMQHITG